VLSLIHRKNFMKTHTTYGSFLRMALVSLTCWTAMATSVHAADVAGINFAPQTKLQGVALQLNGAGVRTLGDSPLYAAALYLEAKATAVPGVLDTTRAKQLQVVMLRPTNGKEMSELLSRGLVANSSDDELAQVIPEMVTIGQFIAKRGRLEAGDSFQIEWLPGVGTTVRIVERAQPGKPVAEVFAKTEFMGALMRIWVGSKPNEAGLKMALLGSPS
jgi:hypothetical protein